MDIFVILSIILTVTFILIFAFLYKNFKKKNIQKRIQAVQIHKVKKTDELIRSFLISRRNDIDTTGLNNLSESESWTIYAYLHNNALPKLVHEFISSHFPYPYSYKNSIEINTHFMICFTELIIHPLVFESKKKQNKTNNKSKLKKLQFDLKYFEQKEAYEKCIEIREQIKQLETND